MSRFQIGAGCTIHPSVVINVRSGFIGAGAVINEGARIEGTHVEIGREAFLDRGATVGAGSCFDPQASLVAGDWLHMGWNSQINTGRGVKVGHEFGCGVETKIFTHGAYIDSYNLGAPVQWEGVEVGDNVWLPNAWVNPGVKIGSNVIVTPQSLIKDSIPCGALAGGAPAKILKEGFLPRNSGTEAKRKLIEGIFEQALLRLKHQGGDASKAQLEFDPETHQARIFGAEGEVLFQLQQKTIDGASGPLSILFKDQLRRNGIRFRYNGASGQWRPWGPDPLSF